MGLFDLPAPLFQAVDGVAAMLLPATLRLLLWGVFAGWLTMVVYRRLSNQERIGELKKQQKARQAEIAEFDGEFDALMPLILATLKLGFRQLGLAIGPALLASLPVLFLVAWVAGAFGYQQPHAGDPVAISTVPPDTDLSFEPADAATPGDGGWFLQWPRANDTVAVTLGGATVLTLPTEAAVPVIHKKQWWNLLFGNPIGYLPDDAAVEQLDLALPAQEFLPVGPGWMRGWMFLFFLNFLVFSVVFKFALKID